MAQWRLTAGLQNLRRQVDDTFPGRDRRSDGTIGDLAHEAEMSSHNPDDTAGSRPAWNGDPDTIPEVRAWDMDADLRFPGVIAQQLVDHVRSLPGLPSVIRYMIYNRRMYHYRDGFAPTAYTGSSAHTEHVHFEGAWTQAADNNTTFDFHLEDLVMTPEDIVNEFANQLGTPESALARRMRAVAWQYVGGGIPPGMSTLAVLNDIHERGVATTTALAALAGKDFTDEDAIIRGVLAGLTAENVAAIPEQTARRAVDLLSARLEQPFGGR